MAQQLGEYTMADIDPPASGGFSLNDIDVPRAAMTGIPPAARSSADWADSAGMHAGVNDAPIGGTLADALPHSKADLVAGAVAAALPMAGPAMRAMKVPPGAWILPGGKVFPLLDSETHINGIERMLGNKAAADFKPFDEGWVRQRGDGIQTSDLRNPTNLAAFNVAAKAAAPGAPVFVSHPTGAVEILPAQAPMFFANPGKFVKLPPPQAAAPPMSATLRNRITRAVGGQGQ